MFVLIFCFYFVVLLLQVEFFKTEIFGEKKEQLAVSCFIFVCFLFLFFRCKLHRISKLSFYEKNGSQFLRKVFCCFFIFFVSFVLSFQVENFFAKKNGKQKSLPFVPCCFIVRSVLQSVTILNRIAIQNAPRKLLAVSFAPKGFFLRSLPKVEIDVKFHRAKETTLQKLRYRLCRILATRKQ